MQPQPIPEEGRILFFARDRAEFGFLSHFCPAPFVLDAQIWPTVEHYYQTHKSLDVTYRRAIRACETPGHAKRLAASPDARSKTARHSWFTKHGKLPRPDWLAVKRDVMRRADAAKYNQNAELLSLLLIEQLTLLSNAVATPRLGARSVWPPVRFQVCKLSGRIILAP